jgi:hypothetical protein
MNETPNEEGIVRDGERAVATPILAALSRHPALRVPLGSASLQWSPPPVSRRSVRDTFVLREVIRRHMKSAMRKTQTAPRIQPQAKGKLLTCSFRIDHETEDQLQAYADFVSSDRSYVIREALKFLFRNDPNFQSHLHGRLLGKHETES